MSFYDYNVLSVLSRHVSFYEPWSSHGCPNFLGNFFPSNQNGFVCNKLEERPIFFAKSPSDQTGSLCNKLEERPIFFAKSPSDQTGSLCKTSFKSTRIPVQGRKLDSFTIVPVG